MTDQITSTEINEELKTRELIAIHNTMADSLEDRAPIATFKQSKTKLIARIMEMRAELAATQQVDETFEGEKPKTIVAASEELLMKTVRVDEDGRNIGMTYNEIVDAIRVMFPEAKTTTKCLRWYAAKMKEADPAVIHRMPVRPRAKRVSK